MKEELVEEWRPVVGYEGLYEVSNLGEVRSLPRTMKARHGGKPDGYHLKGRILKRRTPQTDTISSRLERVSRVLSTGLFWRPLFQTQRTNRVATT